MHPLVPYLRRNMSGIGLTLHQFNQIVRDLNEVIALREDNAALKAQIATLTTSPSSPKGRKESAA